jgi:hypothetical protein
MCKDRLGNRKQIFYILIQGTNCHYFQKIANSLFKNKQMYIHALLAIPKH